MGYMLFTAWQELRLHMLLLKKLAFGAVFFPGAVVLSGQ